MNKFIELYKKYKDKIHFYGIILIVIFLFFSGIVNTCQRKWFNELNYSHKELIAQKEELQTKIDSLNNIFQVKEQNIVNMNFRIDSLKRVIAVLKGEMSVKKQEYDKRIAELSMIPSDTIYKLIIAYNPYRTDDLLKYPFGQEQIRMFYYEHMTLLYQQGLTNDLNKNIGLLEKESGLKSSIIDEKTQQIKLLNDKIGYNNGLLSNLEKDNEKLTKSYKSERKWKNVWKIVSIAEGGLLIYQSVK